MINKNFTIITFYQFKVILNKQYNYLQLINFCKFNKIKGTIILADEGINGTLAGLEKNISELLIVLQNLKFDDLNIKTSYYSVMPFQKLKIKQKKEIVTLKTRKAIPEKISGKKIDYSEWNKIIEDNDTLVIDVRNEFEVSMGSFTGAVNPKTKNFTDFKAFVKKNLANSKRKKIAMYCTGGIRCEKASSYMIMNGFKNVSQLNGGIIKYLENISKNNSFWNGECFVFDERVSLKNELKKGSFKICYGCREPISIKEIKSKFYVEGVCCPNCYERISEKKKKNLMERIKQIQLSKKRGEYNRFIKQTVSDYE